MKKSILLLLCAALSVGMAWGATSPKSQTVQYEIKLKSDAFGNMGVRKMWTKGANVRWEYMSAGLPLKLVKNEQGVFLIHPWNKVAGKYPAGSDRGNPMTLFPGPSGPLDAFLRSVKAVKHGTEKLSSDLCNVYAYTDPVSRRGCRIWISTRSGKPVKLYLAGRRGNADPITATYTKFVVGASVPDSMFTLPKGYAIRPMPTSKLLSRTPTRHENRKTSI